MTISYSAIARQVTVRVDLADLSGRDKAMIFRALVDETGLWTPELDGQPAGEVFTKVIEKLWSLK